VDIVRLCSSLYWWDYEEAPVTLQLVLRGTWDKVIHPWEV
jgi:hypothetical protein